MINFKDLGKRVLEVAEILAIAFILSLIVRSTVVEAREIPTGSMLPTIQINDRVMVDKLFYKWTGLKRDDVVVFRPPTYVDASGNDWIKRIIGLPGDKVEIKDGKVLINGTALKEPFILENPNYQYGPLTVAKDSYFVLGDNRNNSLDSHYWGVLPAKNIIGRAIFRYWPLNHLGQLDK